MAEWWLGPTTADQCGHIPAASCLLVEFLADFYSAVGTFELPNLLFIVEFTRHEVLCV